MTAMGRLAALALLTAPITAGCSARSAGSPPTAVVPEPRPHDLVVLLPDDSSGTTGRAIVMNAAGTIELNAAGAWTRVALAEAPTPPQLMSEQDIRSEFGELLASLPLPVATYTLYFRFDSEELTAESRAQLSQILDATRSRPAPEVVIVGHTDRSGPAEANVELGLKRAHAVRKLLLDTRVDREAIRVSSHGEAEPLIATADNVFEPRNRRVDVIVR